MTGPKNLSDPASGWDFSGARATERKLVTVLVANLAEEVDLTQARDPEDEYRFLSPYLDLIRRILESFGGRAEPPIGGTVMAVFGAHQSHGDDSLRAALAALKIRDTMATASDEGKPPVGFRIGISTGEALVFARQVGAGEQQTVTGQVVSIGNQLQEMAGRDQILVSTETYQASRREIDYHPVLPLEHSESRIVPVVWEAVRQKALHESEVQHSDTQFVDRERELGVLLSTFDRVRSERETQLVTLIGEPGIGKSRLVVEFRRKVDAEPGLLYWRRGRCLPYGQHLAFGVLNQIVKAHVGILETDSSNQCIRKLDQAVADMVTDPDQWAWLTRHLRPLLGLPALDRDIELRITDREESFAAWRRFIEEIAATHPLVLIVEDLQWADNDLLDFLDELTDRVRSLPLLFVVTARPELLERRPDWGGGKRNSNTLSLTPLSAAHMVELLTALLARHRDSSASSQQRLQDLPDALVAKIGGNPLFAEEYVRMLQDRRWPTPAGSRHVEQPKEPRLFEVPPSVRAVIEARLDNLPLEDRAVLRDAAVLGRVGRFGALMFLTGRDRVWLEGCLDRLERREFLHRVRRAAVSDEQEYEFRHTLVREIAYSQITRAERAEKHGEAAKWLESLVSRPATRRSPDHLTADSHLIAYHYQQALVLSEAAGLDTSDLSERARVAFRDAGNRATALGAHGPAAEHYMAALKLWPDLDPDRPELEFLAGEAFCFGEGRGEELLASARDGLLSIGRTERAAEAEILLGSLAYLQGQRRTQHVDRALALVGGAPPSHSKAAVLSGCMMHLLVADRYTEAIRVASEAFAMAKTLGARHVEAAALGTIGAARVGVGDLDGLADLKRCVALCEELSPSLSITWQGNLAQMLADIGDLRGCFAAREAAWQAAERLGSPRWLRWLRLERTAEYYWIGKWDAAIQVADAVIAEAAGGNRHLLENDCHIWRGRIRLAKGEVDAALGDAQAALNLARESGDPQDLDPALAFTARALLTAGRTDEAEAHVSDLIEGLHGHKLKSTLGVDFPVVLSALGYSRGELAHAEVPSSRWLDAATAFIAGDTLEAAKVYAEVGSGPDEAYCRLVAARKLLDAGQVAEGKAQVNQALDFYRRVGASAFVAEATALLQPGG
jgi:class 3 adenylate cyclase/tetratricopeptide (TPR) repeat protein